MLPTSTVEKCAAICQAIADEKATDIAILLVEPMTIVADYFVIGTGTSPVHIRAVADGTVENVREALHQKPRTEGKVDSEWIILDYGDVVVHIFSQERRDFYDLERLWGDAEIAHWDPASGEELMLPTSEPIPEAAIVDADCDIDS